jgi:hypothetical protein
MALRPIPEHLIRELEGYDIVRDWRLFRLAVLSTNGGRGGLPSQYCVHFKVGKRDSYKNRRAKALAVLRLYLHTKRIPLKSLIPIPEPLKPGETLRIKVPYRV